MKKNLDSYEVRLTIKNYSPGQIDILRKVLHGIRIKETQIIEYIFKGEASLTVYSPGLSAAQKIRNKVKKLELKHVLVKLKKIKGKDWQNLWKKEYKPFHLTKRFEVVPLGYRETHVSRGREPVYIDTSYAFGTGLHATTRFMSQFVERCAGKYDSFLDIGTGTGILAILALKCQAKIVKAIDLRKDIIEITNMNFKENGFEKQKAQAINFEKLDAKIKFDYVAANLVTQDLIKYKRKLISLVKTGQYLAVSGISLVNYPLLREHFDQLPIKCIKIERGEGWNAILYKKIKR